MTEPGRATVSNNVISIARAERVPVPEIDFIARYPLSAASAATEAVAALTQEVREITERLQRVEDRLPTEDSAIELRDLPDDRATEEVAAYFTAHAGQTLYYSDLSDALHLPLEQIVRACGRLIQEGSLGIGEHR